jgi:hypothetical protein
MNRHWIHITRLCVTWLVLAGLAATVLHSFTHIAETGVEHASHGEKTSLPHNHSDSDDFCLECVLAASADCNVSLEIAEKLPVRITSEILSLGFSLSETGHNFFSLRAPPRLYV